MSDFHRETSPEQTPWPSEAEIELEKRLLNIEQNQNRVSQLVMQLQLEHRTGINEVKAKVDTLGADMAAQLQVMMSMLKKYLANGN